MRNAYSATERHTERSMRSVRHACSPVLPGSPVRCSSAPYASPTAMRTITMGCTTGAGGATPGIRRPVLTMTDPPTPSRQDAIGASDVPRLLRGDRGRLEPQPRLTHRRCSISHHPIRSGTAILERQVEAHEFQVEAEHLWGEDPQSLLEQLLAGLIALAHDDLAAVGHGSGSHELEVSASRCLSVRQPIMPARSVQPQWARVPGMPLSPSDPGTTPRTWCTEIPPSSNPLADAAM